MDDLIKLEAVKNGGLAGSIEAEHQHASFFAEVGVQKFREEIAHVSVLCQDLFKRKKVLCESALVE